MDRFDTRRENADEGSGTDLHQLESSTDSMRGSESAVTEALYNLDMRPARLTCINVVIVAAQPVVRIGLRGMLCDRPGIVILGEATAHADGVRVVRTLRPDVVLLDPDGDQLGVEAIAQLAQCTPTRIVVFTQADDHEDRCGVVAAGAAGVVRKDQGADLLARAIERVAAGELWLDRRATAAVLRGLQVGEGDELEARKIRSLTQRELEVVALVGSGLKNGPIAERLNISRATVRNHLTSILGKLELADRFDLAFYAAEHGLVGDERGRRPRRDRRLASRPDPDRRAVAAERPGTAVMSGTKWRASRS